MERFKASVREANQRRQVLTDEHKDREEAQRKEFQKMQHDKDTFLSAVNAIPTPLHMYALWLLVYIENGGRITHPRDYAFEGNRRFFMPNPNGSSSTDIVRHGEDSDSASAIMIPEGYGALSMKLLVLPDLPPNISLDPTARSKNRAGWEWGHTAVMTLSPRPGFRLGSSYRKWVATTNQRDAVESFPDVEALIVREKDCKRALVTLRDRILHFNPQRPDTQDQGEISMM